MMVTVILDPGHGTDTYENGGGKGVKVNGKVYEEHDFNSDVALRIEKVLKDHGVNVVFSQKPYSKDVSLTSRTNLAKRIIPKMFVSLHANAGVSSVKGICVFAWENATNSNRMADLVVKHMKAAGIATHGNGRHYSTYNSWTNLHITRELAKANLPGILIEHGFMTNKDDFENIFGKNADSYRQQCAIADSKAILEYLGIKYKGDTNTQSKPIEKPKEEVKIVENAIIINSVNDYPAAELLAKKINCPIYPDKRTFAESGDKVKHMYVVGGDKDGIKADKITLLAGPSRLDTYNEVKKAL